MTLEQQIHDALLANNGVTALIGDRVYLVQLPQNPVYPAVTYQRISTVPLYWHSIGTTVQGQMGWSRFQFTAWCSGASSGQQSDAIARAILAMLYSVSFYALPSSPLVVTQAPNFLLTRSMQVEPNTQPPIFKAVLDVKIWYQDQ